KPDRGVDGVIVPGGPHQIGELQPRNELTREARPGAQLDKGPQRRRGKLRADLAVPLLVKRAERGVGRPRAPVRLESGQGPRPLFVSRFVRWFFRRAGHVAPQTNFSLRAASIDIFSSSTPCFQREMLVSR